VVAVAITVAVYGLVAAIVKMDDVGLSLTQRRSGGSQRVGRALVVGMPILLRWLSRIGTAAMLWVGGHILLVGTDELGWHGPYDVVHDLEELVHDAPASAVLEWLVNTGVSAVVGLVIGLIAVAVVSRITAAKRHAPHEATT
jgi:predicted DNA repair protein MutK